MDALKQALKPGHMAFFSHLRGINWANGAAMLLMVLYLLAILYSGVLQNIFQAIEWTD
ncbi:MAG TPA: hypothetical protein VIN67_04755 [Desulfobaccales bacterium]